MDSERIIEILLTDDPGPDDLRRVEAHISGLEDQQVARIAEGLAEVIDAQATGLATPRTLGLEVWETAFEILLAAVADEPLRGRLEFIRNFSLRALRDHFGLSHPILLN